VALRSVDVLATPETPWTWLQNSYELLPECRDDVVEWSYDRVDSPWHLAFTTGVHPTNVRRADGVALLTEGVPALVDVGEVRAKAAEAAQRLFSRLT